MKSKYFLRYYALNQVKIFACQGFGASFALYKAILSVDYIIVYPFFNSQNMCFQEGLRMTFLNCRVPNVLFYQILFDKLASCCK